VFTIPLPPLRERDDDLAMLIGHFLRRFSRELGKQVRDLTPEAQKLLCRYPWPGNIRELQGVLKQAILQATGTVLIPAFLPESLRTPPDAAAGPVPGTTDAEFSFEAFILQRIEQSSTTLSAEAHQHLDRLLLRLTLRSTNANQVQAARTLGISRQTLRSKTRELGISLTGSDESDEDQEV
jgi:two-component system nitrogen regulation response regulator GlnG